MLNFLTISGSLRAASTNTAALEALSLLVPPEVTIRRYDGLASLPAFNPDLEEANLPLEVIALRGRMRQSDALIISSPEYARGIAGALKNLLDWMVADQEFAGKPAALITTSQRAEDAPAQLRLVLRTMSAHLSDPTCVTLPLLGQVMTFREIAENPELSKTLSGLLAALIKQTQIR